MGMKPQRIDLQELGNAFCVGHSASGAKICTFAASILSTDGRSVMGSNSRNSEDQIPWADQYTQWQLGAAALMRSHAGRGIL